MGSLIAELKRRSVFKVGIAYAIVAWLLIQVIVSIETPLHLPDWADTFTIVLLIIGFPVALILAWAYEMTPEGIKPTQPIAPVNNTTHLSGRKLDFIIIGLLSLAVIFLVVNNYVLEGDRNQKSEVRMEEASNKASDQEQISNDIAEKTTEPAPAAGPASNTIAVLPFTDMSPNKDQEYFADGLTEELLNKLSQVKDLQVTGRTSSFYFKGRNEDLRTIGEMLGVAHLLEGSVRKDGNRLRITAQLIKVADGYHLWSNSYDRELTDIFAVQDEIAKAVTTALSITLGAGEFSIPGMTRNINAYEEFLLAGPGGNTLSDIKNYSERLQADIEHAKNAVRSDPEFGAAWARLWELDGYYIDILPPRQAITIKQEAKEALVHAQSVSPDNPWVQAAIIQETRQAGKLLEADRLLQQFFSKYNYSIELANRQYSALLIDTGRSREAVIFIDHVQSLDPMAGVYNFHKVLGLLSSGRFDDALADVNVPDKNILPTDGIQRWTVALVMNDRHKAAAIIKAANSNQEYVRGANDMQKAAQLLDMEDTEVALNEIRQMADDPDTPMIVKIYLVNFTAALGDAELALTMRNQLHIKDWQSLLWMPYMRDVRRLPGFKTLVKDEGLLDYWRATGHWADLCHPVGEDDFECI